MVFGTFLKWICPFSKLEWYINRSQTEKTMEMPLPKSEIHHLEMEETQKWRLLRKRRWQKGVMIKHLALGK